MAQRASGLTVILTGLLLAAPATGGDAALSRGLSKGINFDHIFDPYRNSVRHPYSDEDRERIAAALREEEFKQVAELGFTHIRLNLGMVFFQDPKPPFAKRHANLVLLDRALDFAAGSGLGVVLDVHQIPVPNLTGSKDERENFTEMWKMLAKRYRSRKQALVFELLNEPRVEDPEVWREISSELIREIRKLDPGRAIIVTGGGWGGVEDLLKSGGLEFDNLAYSFHFYDPFVFTHQGATWTGKELRYLKGIRYPIDPAQMKAERAAMEERGLSSWPFDDWMGGGGKAALAARIEPAARLAKEQGLLLYCGEFGTHKPWAPPADRARWTADVREILEENGIGWAMWAYHAGYDLVEEDGSPTPAIVKALGL